MNSTKGESARKSDATLCVLYGVFGLPKDASSWREIPELAANHTDRRQRTFQADILGSSPKSETAQDAAIAKLLHIALKASLPLEVTIEQGAMQPPCVNHSFVLQQSTGVTLYGVALKVWSKADSSRCAVLRGLSADSESSRDDAKFWIPYIRAMWIHWSKSNNLYHAEEVSRILSFPAPRLLDLVRIDMKDYALVYQFPGHARDFQNFDLWPLFSCLTIPHIAGIIETALSSRGKVIFTSDHLAILTIAAESIRLACRTYDWAGLYVPVIHWRDAQHLLTDKGPYILGLPKCLSTFVSIPNDALLVDLDSDSIRTTQPPVVFSKSSSREKFIKRLTCALGAVETTGVPRHLCEAYAKNQLTPEGQVVPIRGRIEIIEDPVWWNQQAVMAEFDRVCSKFSKNRGLKAIIHGPLKRDGVLQISEKELRKLERESSLNARDARDAWTSYCSLKTKLQAEITRLSKSNDFLVDEIGTWKIQFEKFQVVAQDLTKQSLELKHKIEAYRSENYQLSLLIKEREIESNKANLLLKTTQKERDQAKNNLKVLAREKAALQDQLKSYKTQNHVLLTQRAEVENVLHALRTLIETQPAALASMLQRKSDDSRIRPLDSVTKSDSKSPRTDAVSPLSSKIVPENVSETRHQTHSNGLEIADPETLSAVHHTKHEISDLISRVTNECLAALDTIKDVDQFPPVSLTGGQDHKSAKDGANEQRSSDRSSSAKDDVSSRRPGLKKPGYDKFTASMPEIRV